MAKTRWLFIHPFQMRLQRGIEVYLWSLASALAQSGIEVDILTWAGHLDIPNYVQIAGVRVLYVPSVRYFQHIFALPFYFWHLLIGRYDQIFVHFAGYGEGPALCLARWFRPMDFSVVFHFPPSMVPHRFREFERWEMQCDAKYLIAVSQSTAREVENWARRHCVVIGHGVNVEHFKMNAHLRNQVRKQLGIDIGAPVLISVAALEERKGIQWGIKALHQLIQQRPDFHYIIVGEGAYRGFLEAMVTELNIKNNVHFMGAKLDVHPYLCAGDIMLVLSHGEASSISLLEAMSCQLPSITSRQPPFDELVDETRGVRVDADNIQQVTSAISELFGKPVTRLEMGRAARDSISKAHQWYQVARQYRDLIAVSHSRS